MSVLSGVLASIPSDGNRTVRANLEASEDDRLPEIEVVAQMRRENMGHLETTPTH